MSSNEAPIAEIIGSHCTSDGSCQCKEIAHEGTLSLEKCISSLRRLLFCNLPEFFVSFVTLFSHVYDPKGIMGIVLKRLYCKQIIVFILTPKSTLCS